MMKRLLIILFVVNLTIGGENYGAPKLAPYEYGYGVNDQATGDVKEHYETRLENGRTVGEYKLLQENGLFRVVRYFVEGDSGFQAAVTEEKGEEVTNYAFNTQNGDSKASLRENPIVRNDIKLSDVKLDAAASTVSLKFKTDSSEDKNVDYEFLDPQKQSTVSDVASDGIQDVDIHTMSTKDSFERSNKGANHQPSTDSEEYDNPEDFTTEDYFEEELKELTPPQVNFESAYTIKTDLPSSCKPFGQNSPQQRCISSAPKTSTETRPVTAPKLFNIPHRVNKVSSRRFASQPQYSTEASEDTKHFNALSQPKKNIQLGRTPFVHDLSHNGKIIKGNHGSSNFESTSSQISSTVVKLDNNNNSHETRIFPQNKNSNSFLHHHSYSPYSNKIFRTIVHAPTIRVDERQKDEFGNVNSVENAQQGNLNLVQKKERPNTASSKEKTHSLSAHKNKKISKQLTILNSKGEKIFLPEIPLDQIRKIIVVDGMGSAPRVLLDSSAVSQKSKEQNLKSIHPVSFFQNRQDPLSSLDQKFNEKFTGLSRKPTSPPSFESLRSQRNLETLKILADVKYDNHVRKTRQQIIENVLNEMNKNQATSSDNNESFSGGRLYSSSNFYSR